VNHILCNFKATVKYNTFTKLHVCGQHVMSTKLEVDNLSQVRNAIRGRPSHS